jgi:CheY-like chemotaxis protein
MRSREPGSAGRGPAHPECEENVRSGSLFERRTVLVVEDDADMRETCARILRRSGHVCLTAANGREALALLQHERPDLILADLRMPEVDGLALLRQSRHLAPEIPVAIFTAYVSEESAREALNAGAAAYLAKPFSPSQLRQTVEQMLIAPRQVAGIRT